MIAAAPSGLPIHTPEFASHARSPSRATGRWSTAPWPWPGRSPTCGSSDGALEAVRAEFAATMDRVGPRRPAVRDRGGGRRLTYGSRRLPGPADDRLHRRGVHARRGGHPPALLHQPRRSGVRPGQPARGGEGRPVRPLLAAAPRACGGCSSTSSSATSTSPATPPSTPRSGLRRAEELYDRVFFEYGDDSVAQLGGVHLACEQASNLLTKVLEWGRLMAYLEQSTRYIAYDTRLGGRYRYYRDPEVLGSELGTPLRRRHGPAVRHLRRAGAGDGRLLPGAVPEGRRPTPTSCTARRSGPRPSTRCGACCPPRRCRTSASTAPARATRRCCCACASHPLPEARAYADLMLTELRKVIPSFLKRVDLDDRGVAWSTYLATHPVGDGGDRGRGCSPTAASAAEAEPGVQLARLGPRRRGEARRRDALLAHATCPRRCSSSGCGR